VLNVRRVAEGLPDRLCREAWEVSSDGLVLFDIDGNVLAFDNKFADLFSGPVTSAGTAAIFPRDCRPAELIAAANPTATKSCDLTVGEGRRLRVRCDCVRVEEGLLASLHLGGEPHRGAAGKRAERSAQQLKWMRAILDTTAAVIIVLDREGRFIRFNRAAEALTGFRSREVRGKHVWQTVLFEEDAEKMQAGFHALSMGSTDSLRLESRWRMRDGSARTLSWSSVVTRGRSGNPDCVVAAGVDVTSLRETERALASLSREFMEARSAARREISRHLHDTIAQHLVVLGLSLTRLEREPDRITAGEVKKTLSLIDRCCRDLRVISYALAPPLFDDADAGAAFDWYSRVLQDDARVDVEFKVGALPAGTSPQVRLLLLAAVQEWAQKAIRYPGAAKTLITLETITPADAGPELRLEFVSGQPENEAVKEILMSPVIRERVRALRGRCEATHEQGGISARISVSAAGVST
jgi:PAS domain S-box-containing protein